MPGVNRTSVAPLAKAALLTTGFYSAFRKVLPSRGVAILRYHAVCDSDAGYADPGICISPAAFAQHAEYLARHYRVLSLPDVVAALKRGISLPSNAVALTFDDGYADNLEAARTLARFGLTATFYLTAGCLSGGDPFWPSELRALIKAMPGPSFELTGTGERLTFAVATSTERRAAVAKLTKLFKAHRIATREALREQLRRLSGSSIAASPMLTWDNVREMHRLGMVIGSHTMTHPNLPNAGLEDARREIVESKGMLEDSIGRRVTMFSYPNGGAERYMTPEIAQLVREAGFEGATTSRNAFAGPDSDPFALERVQVAERLDDIVFALEIERFAFKPQPRRGELQ